jgi:uncharacterized alkaline shock family protein YloU
MVDDVCLYDARTSTITSKYQQQLNNLENSIDQEEKQAIEEMLQLELQSVTLRSVPLKMVKEDNSSSSTKIKK